MSELRQETVHRFNVIFKVPRRSLMDDGGIVNVTSFSVVIPNWTTPMVYGTGIAIGKIDLYCLPYAINSGSTKFFPTTTVQAIPRMYYSACAVFNGSTVISSSPVVSIQTTYDY